MSKAAPSADAPAKKSPKLLILIVLAVVLLAGGGAAAWFFLKAPAPSGEAAAPVPKTPVFLALDTFTVNLADGERYLQTDITLQFFDPKQIELMKLHMPRVRSRLITLLSSQTADTLMTEADKARLAKAILDTVNTPLDGGKKPQEAVDVLFTSFVIQ